MNTSKQQYCSFFSTDFPANNNTSWTLCFKKPRLVKPTSEIPAPRMLIERHHYERTCGFCILKFLA
jgi:hypothetical protein